MSQCGPVHGALARTILESVILGQVEEVGILHA